MQRPYLLKKRARYWYYRLAGERTFHSTGQTSKTSAIHYAQAVLDGSVTRTTTPTLSQFSDEFFEWGRCQWIERQIAKGVSFSRATAAMRRGHLDNWLLPAFGDRPLDEFDAVTVENWLLTVPRSNQTRNHILYTLSIIMREARRNRVISENPLADVESLSTIGYRKRDVFTRQDLELLFPTDLAELARIWSEPKHAVMAVTILVTGARSGEARALEWQHVSFRYRAVGILQAAKPDATIGPTKTGNQRIALLPDFAVKLLAWWKHSTPYSCDDDLVFFGSDRHRPMRKETLLSRLRTALVRAGVEGNGRNLVVHGYRHTFNTTIRNVRGMLDGSELDAVIRDLMGHQTQPAQPRPRDATPVTVIDDRTL